MTLDEFISHIASNETPERRMPPTAASLWWDRKGDWDRAHTIAQSIPTVQGSAVHAYLHREEGVLWNADYWYRRAGRQRPTVSLTDEWTALAQEMLADG